MYLGKILGTGTKLSALGVLLNSPGRSYSEVELARESGAPVSELNRQMPDLVGSGLVRLERIGRMKLYSLNSRHFLAKPLKGLFLDLNRVYLDAAKRIVRFAARSQGLESAILIGSAARESVSSDLVKAPSDLDLVFVVKSEQGKAPLFDSLVSFINSEISLSYGIACYPVVVSRKEYIRALESRNPFILKAQAEGITLHGRKPGKVG